MMALRRCALGAIIVSGAHHRILTSSRSRSKQKSQASSQSRKGASSFGVERCSAGLHSSDGSAHTGAAGRRGHWGVAAAAQELLLHGPCCASGLQRRLLAGRLVSSPRCPHPCTDRHSGYRPVLPFPTDPRTGGGVKSLWRPLARVT